IIKVNLTKTKATILTEIIEQLYKFNDLSDPEELIEVKEDGTISTLAKNAQSVIIQSVVNKNYVFAVDDIDIATPQMLELILDLINHSTIIATTTEIKNERKIKHLYSLFDKIHLNELDKTSAENFTDYLIQTYIPKEIDTNYKSFLKNEALRISKGNPSIIKSILAQASAQKLLNEDEIKKLRNLESPEYINLGPVFGILLGSITIVKILQIGLENRETYILLSIFSFIAYIIIRIFRYFFLFRPQRNKP
ncbi:MAG: hypothetical protein ABDI07_10360, partial [Candidatus Kryptonium sp.]